MNGIYNTQGGPAAYHRALDAAEGQREQEKAEGDALRKAQIESGLIPAPGQATTAQPGGVVSWAHAVDAGAVRAKELAAEQGREHSEYYERARRNAGVDHE